jgi:putative addiction module component (TIGR02574 family)
MRWRADVTRTLQQLETEIRSLSSTERARLLRDLIADLDGEIETGVESAWLDEVERRQRELTEGVVEPIPAREVFDRARSRLKK